MKTLIYALIAPDTGEIRYIGLTSRTLAVRLQGHIDNARSSDRNSRRAKWIRSLLKRGLRPSIVLIEQCDTDGCAEERHHISLARRDGIRLTNGTDGGDQSYSVLPSVRLKMSQRRRFLMEDPDFAQRLQESGRRLGHAQRGISHSSEHVEKRIAPLRGRAQRPDVVERKSQILRGRRLPEETKEKIRLAMLGKTNSPATRAKLSAALKGRTFSAEWRGRLSESAKQPDVLSSSCARIQSFNESKRLPGWDKERHSSAMLERRKHLHLSRPALAPLVGLTVCTIRLIEIGQAYPSTGSGQRIQAVLGQIV